ncbi:MAG: PAC2 family protein [Dehalococcoidia bacterium]|nr:PAC2 family protein [Dehalococcoidia bacterium]
MKLNKGDMPDIEILSEPELIQPTVIAAFSGWSDAGEAATSALRFLSRRWKTELFAQLDPEEYYDFTQTRPHVKIENGERLIEWPANKFSFYRTSIEDKDFILISGVEPHINWKKFVRNIAELCKIFNVTNFITLGGLLAEVSHNNDIQVGGSATNPELSKLLGFEYPRLPGYQGPTGILSVLNQNLHEYGIETASLWANIPFYIQRTPNPKGALALLRHLNNSLTLDLSLHDLEVFSARFEAQVAKDLEQNPEASDYARQIEEETQKNKELFENSDTSYEELPDAEFVVDELEEFLRQQREDEN